MLFSRSLLASQIKSRVTRLLFAHHPTGPAAWTMAHKNTLRVNPITELNIQ